MELTGIDLDDLIEGYRKRKPTKIQNSPELLYDQKVIYHFMESQDLYATRKKFNLTSSELENKLKQHGIL